MKKLSVAFLAVLALSCTATGGVKDGIADNIKEAYDIMSKTGTVQVTAADAVRVFGSREILDMCIANGWKASPIAKAVAGKKITSSMGGVLSRLPQNEQAAFIKAVASGHSKWAAVYVMVARGKAVETPELMPYIFAIDDGTETNGSRSVNIRNYCTVKSIRENKLTGRSQLSIADLVDFLLLGGEQKIARDVEWAKSQIKSLAAPRLKSALRAKGKSFVTKDGVNPIEGIMKPVVDALNAPKLQGLEAALRDIGVEIADVERAPAIWDPIIAEKNAIFMGDKPAHPALDGGIMLLLGPDGYNAWVKEFNEGK